MSCSLNLTTTSSASYATQSLEEGMLKVILDMKLDNIKTNNRTIAMKLMIIRGAMLMPKSSSKPIELQIFELSHLIGNNIKKINELTKEIENRT